ncbi:MAG: DNA-3-methyladenine glycosylase 2 family protein [Acidimicrobiia bacterium]|nr:DNA-3-methyladenine glycosylase 2 family protein [Acidimicrobiia bacterium]
MPTRSWPLSGPLDLLQTLRFSLPGVGASSRRGSAAGAYAHDTAAGPASVELTVSGGRLEAKSVGPGAELALDSVPRVIGLDDDPTLFPTEQGPLRDLHLRNLGLRLGSTGRVFDTLLPTILGQRVTTEEAERSYRLLIRSFGKPAPGDSGLQIPPAAASLASLVYEDLHTFGIERSRAQLVIEAARRAGRLEEIVGMGRDDAVRRLRAVRGIGPWTAGLVMGAAWGDRDALPRGDFHIPHSVSWLLAGEPRGSDDRMEELLDPYRPYRRRAMILVKLSGVHAPRYGPRSPKSTISGS